MPLPLGTSPRASADLCRASSATTCGWRTVSLMETTNHLQDGRDRGYLTDADIVTTMVIARRASAAVTRLIRYPRSSSPEPSNQELVNLESVNQ